ncbi:nodulation protein NolU [Bradyrhizobium sp. UFLA05-153]
MPVPMQSVECHRSFKSPSVSLTELAGSAHPTRLAARLDTVLSASTLARLQKSSRLQLRLVRLLLDNEVDLNGKNWEPDLLLGHDPRRAALLAGSIWHARSLLKLVSKHELSILIERIGAEAHAFGIRHMAHAIATESVTGPEQLAHQIEYDGHGCLGAWLDEHPAPNRDRVLLRLPVGTAAEGPATEHRIAAGCLFSLVVAHLGTEIPTV